MFRFIVLAVPGVLALLAAPLAGQVALVHLDGEPLEGRLVGLSADGVALRPAGATADVAVPLARAVALDFGGLAAPPDPRSGLLRFELAGGDVLHGAVIAGDYDAVRIETRALGALRVPLDGLRRVVVPENAGDAAARAELAVPDERDLVLLRTPRAIDRVSGSVARFTPKGVLFEWGGEGETPFEFERDRVVAVALAPLGPPRALPARHAVVSFRDGSRLSGVPGLEDGAIVLTLASGETVRPIAAQIHRVAFRGGDFVHLSDLEPLRVEETPMIGGSLTYGLHRDEDLDGGPAVIAGTTYPKALAVHTRCAVTYRVPEGYVRFDSAYGVSDAVRERAVKGAVAFSVRVGETTVAGPAVRRAGEPAQRFASVAVTPGGELTLLADFADTFHFNGWAVWGEPMLVREPAPAPR